MANKSKGAEITRRTFFRRLGLAGAGRGLENAERTAEFINRTGPTRIINFTIFHHESAPLDRDVEAGIFVPSGELENLLEERKLI